MKRFEKNNFKGRRVLVFGLGLLGGGVATTNWLIKHGARVTVTDLKDENYLEPSLKRLKGKLDLQGRPLPRAPLAKGAPCYPCKLKLGGHDKKDIEKNEVVVFNPDVSVNNPFVKYVRKLGKQVENEATIFYKLCHRPIIAITGTRGKTTTSNWIGYFLNGKKYNNFVTGNSYDQPLLKTLDPINSFSNSPSYAKALVDKSAGRQEFENKKFVVNEIPSYHLEYFTREIPPPEIAIITNLLQDHLNRHGTMKKYALAKSMIFQNQTANQNLILNYDDKWTSFFLKQKPCSKVWFFSSGSMPKKLDGLFRKNKQLYFQENGKAEAAIGLDGFEKQWGSHNLKNLIASSLAAHFAGIPWTKIQQKIKTLPQVPFRQETVFDGSIKLAARNNHLRIINDTSATSPDGGLAAVKRFGSPNTILISGGTDRNLDYKEWAKEVKREIKQGNLILLEGSATDKMIKKLRFKNYDLKIKGTLAECFKEALKIAGRYKQSVILFSPAAKSFEKFKNEYDRGKQFNSLIRRLK